MTTTDTLDSTLEPITSERSARRRIGWLSNLDPSSPLLTWVGLLIAALGFAAIAFAWGKVAGLDNVALQLPYVMSGGLTGLALVMVGMTAVNVAARRQDSAQRARESQELKAVLRELRETLER